MQQIVLVVLVPALLCITALYGVYTYRGLHQVILGGFDQKLQAVSSTSASFIDGDEHVQLLQKRQIQGITVDDSTGMLFGIDSVSGAVVKIDPHHGGIVEQFDTGQGIAGSPRMIALAVGGTEGKTLYGLDGPGGVVYATQLPGIEWKKLLEVPLESRSLAWRSSESRLFVAGRDLRSFVPGSREFRTHGSIPEASLVFFAGDRLWGIESRTGAVILLDSALLRYQHQGIIRDENELQSPAEESASHAEEQLSPVGSYAPPIIGAAYHPALKKLFVVTDQLVAVDLATLRASASSLAVGFRHEENPLYLKYVRPMQRILNEAELTYHYTQVPFGSAGILYVLDATSGEDHSPIGTEEENPPEEAERLNRVMTTAQVSLSEIQEFDLWGFLKIGSAPILNQQGVAVGLVGADVNISVIHRKTSHALLQVLGIGVCALAGALLVSLVIAQRLVQPLRRLKDGALRIAAGEYEYIVDVQKPSELHELSQGLNEMRHALGETIAALEVSNAAFETLRCRQEVTRILGSDEPAREGIHHRWKVESGAVAGPAVSRFGFAGTEDTLVVWNFCSQASPETCTRLSGDMRRLIPRLLRQGIVHPGHYLPPEISFAAIFRAPDQSVQLLRWQSDAAAGQTSVVECPDLILYPLAQAGGFEVCIPIEQSNMERSSTQHPGMPAIVRVQYLPEVSHAAY